MNPSLLSTANGSPIQSLTERPHLVWGAPTAAERGPVIATLRNPNHRNAVGSHAGGYSVYRALAIAARTLAHDHIADLTDTAPVEHIGPHPQWCDAKKIVSRAATTCGPPSRSPAPISTCPKSAPPSRRAASAPTAISSPPTAAFA